MNWFIIVIIIVWHFHYIDFHWTVATTLVTWVAWVVVWVEVATLVVVAAWTRVVLVEKTILAMMLRWVIRAVLGHKSKNTFIIYFLYKNTYLFINHPWKNILIIIVMCSWHDNSFFYLSLFIFKIITFIRTGDRDHSHLLFSIEILIYSSVWFLFWSSHK